MNDSIFARLEASPSFGFAGAALDRVSDKREDDAYLAALRARPDAQTLMFCRDMPVFRKIGEALEANFALTEPAALGATGLSALLGVEKGGRPLFAVALADAAVEQRADASDGFLDKRVLVIPGREDLELIDLRSIAVQGLARPQIVAQLGQAKALLHWHAKHSHCANCGAPTLAAAAGWRRECAACKTQHFPRTDPVVIMLAVDGDHCLLGRQARFPALMYSCLAGFLEPGETIEEAVRREIAEEAGVICGKVAYLASQPWPFPASLMIGCLAQATSRKIAIDGVELEDARWFSRAECRLMLAGKHPQGLISPTRMAIAHHILKTWVDHSP